MTEHKEETQTKKPREEIDLLELFHELWQNKKLLLKASIVALCIGVVVAFSIPKEYTSTVTLAPEVKAKGLSGGVGAIAAMAGMNLGSSTSDDALSPDLYPEIVSSTPFLMEISELPILFSTKQIKLYYYLQEEQRVTWWRAILGLPFKVFESLKSTSTESPETTKGPSFEALQLSKSDVDVVKELNNRIRMNVDTKTGVTTISAQMQNPIIAAQVVDTVVKSLKNYITNYRTNKARQDLAFTESLFEKAKQDYFTAQAIYAQYMDENQNVVLQRYRTEQERLQNEVNLTYGVYSQVAQQLQLAKARVQERTPVFAVLQPAEVPIRASKPNKLMILVGFIFLANIVGALWILLLRDFVENLRNKK